MNDISDEAELENMIEDFSSLITEASYVHDDWLEDKGYEGLQRKELLKAINKARKVVEKLQTKMKGIF
jgi:hypothetical protein